ncbi:MAG: IS66 family transposase [Candidatus Peribacteraceae bacterium]|jgi:transposase
MAETTMKELLAKLAESVEENAALRKENALLRQKVDMLSRMIYGTSSEAFNPNQPDLFGVVPGSGEDLGKGCASFKEETSHEKKERKERAPRVPDNLPVEEIVIEPLEVQAEPEAYKCIGEEVSEQLDYSPGAFRRVRTVRRKYVRKAVVDPKPVIAPLPPKLQDGCIAAPGLLASIIVGRYVDHLPFYRQEQIFKTRHEVMIPRQNMVRWSDMVSDRLEPIYNILKDRVLSGDYIQMDETPIRYLDPGSGKTQIGYMWVTLRPGGDAIFQWKPSRAAQCVKDILPKDFKGILQTDAYAAYGSFAKERPDVVMAGCMTHVRRRFYQSFEQKPGVVTFLLNQFASLYRVESSLRKRKAGPALREADRASVSRPILARLERALKILQPKFFPQSNLGKAISYALTIWSSLGVYLEAGRVEIDNNLIENAIRPTAVGKKNWLFIGAAGAGKKSAILYTIVESCRRQGIDPHAYLHDVLTRLPRYTNQNISELTPENWAKARSASQRQYAAAA